jgi:crotonobetainyl-CoA:carnitine CoA-transferase CaiB-like acyl-CoA transferase
MSADLAPLTAAAALADLASKGISAVPVQTLKELVERHRSGPTRTVRFEKRERDGWVNECFAPTWFAIDGVANARPAAPPRIGSDAPAILAELGYTASDIERLEDSGIVGPIEWYRRM